MDDRSQQGDDTPAREHDHAIPRDPAKLAEIAVLLRDSRHVLITAHARVDWDALGSQLALGRGLGSIGKRVTQVTPSEIAERFHLDPGAAEVLVHPTPLPDDIDAIVILDLNAWERLDDLAPVLQSLDVPVACLDHHQLQKPFVPMLYVDPGASCTGELVLDLLDSLDITVDREIAHYLYLALCTDTGNFQFSNSTPSAFRMAARLVEAGVVPADEYELVWYNKPLRKYRLLGRALGSIRLAADGRVASMLVTREDIEVSGAEEADAEDFVEHLRKLQGVEVSLLCMERTDGSSRISLRSKRLVDVCAVARHFGGGGHIRASGIKNDRPVRETLEAVIAHLEGTVFPAIEANGVVRE